MIGKRIAAAALALALGLGLLIASANAAEAGNSLGNSLKAKTSVSQGNSL